KDPAARVSPIESGAIVTYQPVMLNGVEQALVYNLGWSSVSIPDCESPTPSGTNGGLIISLGSEIVAGSGRTVILDGNGQNPFTAGQFVDGQPYFFCMQAIAQDPATGKSVNGAWIATDPPVTIGPATADSGTNTVSVNVTVPDPVTLNGPLYVGCYDRVAGRIYALTDEAPVNGSQAYAVDGIPTGAQCSFFAIIDDNNDGFVTPSNPSPTLPIAISTGDISNTGQNPPPITITGNTTVNVDLTPFDNNSVASLTTQHTQ